MSTKPTTTPPARTDGAIYRGRPQSLDPPVGRRAVRAPVAAVAALYVLIGLTALILRWTAA